MSERPVAIVTGSASGIGAACAIAMAEAGCDIAVNYRASAEAADSVVNMCRKTGADAEVFKADVASDGACRALVSDVTRRFGRLDVLVNNAGITKIVPGDPLENVGETDFDRLFQVNVRAAFQLSRAAAERLSAARGSIVNVSSASAQSGFASSMIYAASKGALNTLTLALARRLAPEIRVNAVCPGFVATRWMQKAGGLTDDELARFEDRVRNATPLRRVTTPDDVADAVVWLALRAPAITGQLLVIDGGAHLAVMDPIKSAQIQ